MPEYMVELKKSGFALIEAENQEVAYELAKQLNDEDVNWIEGLSVETVGREKT